MSGGLFVLLFLLTTISSCVAVAEAYVYFSQDLPSPDAIAEQEIAQTTKVYDRKGRLLYEFFDPNEGRRTSIPLSEMSPYVIQATIATEDANFYSNPGINIRGILRAVWNNITNQREGLQGGSSITQQLVKNVLIPVEERSQPLVSRKIKEVILAHSLTRKYPKDTILEWYLNQIYYGNLSYGIQSAAESYFNKNAQDLSLAEAAMLAGLPQAPGKYSPLTNPELAKQRQHDVLDLMVRHDLISQEQAEAAKKEELLFVSRPISIEAPHFVMFVRDILEQEYGDRVLYRGGLEITTSLDLDLQEKAETIIQEQGAQLARYNASNAALVALDPRTGEVLAMVGSANYFDRGIQGQVNMATSERQPGSAFKPFTYLTAFMKGWSPATMVQDTPTTFKDRLGRPYTPVNVDKTFRGPVSVRQALGMSMNIPAVKTIQFAGVDDVLDTAHKMGITTLNQKGWYDLALTLGGGEVKLLDMAFAYAVMANGGEMIGLPVPREEQQPGMRKLEPVPVLKVEKPNGEVLFEFAEPERERVISSQLAYLITNILSDNEARAPLFGSNSPLVLPGRPAAVKTGSTDDWKDTWAVGYTPQLVTGVWVGNADNTSMSNVLSVTTAGPIWHKFMVQALAGVKPVPFTRPPGIKEVEVCVPSGLLPTPHCPKTRVELFLEGNVPTKTDDMFLPTPTDTPSSTATPIRTPTAGSPTPATTPVKGSPTPQGTIQVTPTPERPRATPTPAPTQQATPTSQPVATPTTGTTQKR